MIKNCFMVKVQIATTRSVLAVVDNLLWASLVPN